ncbi:MAG: N-formylglutamate deformylase [Pseudomonadota bacterium]
MFTLTPGTAPLLVSFPHAGTEIPNALAARMTPEALARADVDWHLPQLYAFARALGASTLVARFARHVVDLNRPPKDESLYPGQDVTGLLPLDTFRKEPLYREGEAPGAVEVEQRRATYWQPYHDALRAELARLRTLHGSVVLWDAHSIASVMPRFFDGKLPDLNLGTADGKSCAPALQAAVEAAMAAQTQFTHVSNGRFKGGYITRHYGQPGLGVHALQLEMCQSTYMDETAPFGYRVDRAAQVQPLLERMLDAVLQARPQGA